MQKYLVTVECAIEHNGKFLVIQRPMGTHAGGTLSFPAGKVEENEADPKDILRSAAKREVLEEVGLALEDPIDYITTTSFISDKGIHVMHSVFYCRLKKTIPHVVASPREVPAYYWMTADEINKAENAPIWLKHYVELISL